MRTSQRSQLPTFLLGDVYKTAIGADSEEQFVAEITCPRSYCGKTFIVPVKTWWRQNHWEKSRGEPKSRKKGRPCPHCFAAGYRPKKPRTRKRR